jgi:antibiotic biosynthesis monooxygenase (ABM) superfamily enzyme
MIVLQIYFSIAPPSAAKFEEVYATSYKTALQKQEGYQASRLLRIFEPSIAAEIEAAHSDFNYQMELQFSTEEARRRWVQSPEHQEVWPLASSLAATVEWRGYELAGDDRMAL